MDDITTGYKSPIISAFGNPLLDMHVTIDNTDILHKYGLELDCEKEVSFEELAELQQIRSRYPSVTSAGGSAQNTLRMFQWLVGQRGSSLIFGAVGQDEEGKVLEALMTAAGVCTEYTCHEGLPTGRCVALVKDEHRALVAHIGAAAIYDSRHLDRKDHLEVLARSKIVYIEGFFVSHSFPVAQEVFTFCRSRGILTAFNLSSVYICKNNTTQVLQLIPHADVVFGNEAAFKALAESSDQTPELLVFQNTGRQGGSVGPERIVGDETAPATMFAILRAHGRVSVATNGPHPVKCKTGRGEYLEVPVPNVNSVNVRDTTGAGDAFVAGFLAAVVGQKNLEACIKVGCSMAMRVIQHVGCQVPSCLQSDVLSTV